MGSLHYRGTRRELYEVGEERRGRPRGNKVKLFFRLRPIVQEQLDVVANQFPHLKVSQSELVGLGVDLLGFHLDRMAAALGREDRILSAGVVDLESLYLMWNLKFPPAGEVAGTTVYLLPHQTVRLGDIRARLRLQIRVSQSDLLNLGLALLAHLAASAPKNYMVRTADDLWETLPAFV